MAIYEEVVKQLDAVLAKYQEMRSRSKWDDCSDHPPQNVTALIALMCDTISRFAPQGSQYMEGMRALVKKFGIHNGYIIPHLAGVLIALKTAYEAGYLTTITDLLHADTFSNFIDMAVYLLSEGYKDAAAVIVGSVIEEHIRQLCIKNGIPVETSGKPKKTDALNSDLTSATVYSKLDQKTVTSWLDLRNKAAHGKYEEYTKEQVTLMLQGVQNFIARNPA